MAVNGLVTSLIVFRIITVFLEVKAGSTSVERTLDLTGGTKIRHIIFVIIESGMTLLVIQLINMVLWVLGPVKVTYNGTGPVSVALDYVAVLNEMFNVIIRSVHLYFFYFTENSSWLGNHTNNNFGTGVNEIVLR